MERTQRKREVSACIPCYTRKQKCNRRYPCDHCTRRRRPEMCAYYPPQATQASGPLAVVGTHQYLDAAENLKGQLEHGLDRRASNTSPTLPMSLSMAVSRFPKETPKLSSVADLFGYIEGSRSTTLALVQTLGIHDEGRDISLPAEIVQEVQKALETLPSRPILDFMVQYFMAEVNWIDQLLYPPWFLVHYQKWWNLDRPYSVNDIEFSVLFLRICCYASQFLPSPSYTTDSIRGVTLLDIRNACTTVADLLQPICLHLDDRGSLIRVQHLAFSGLVFLCQGQVNSFWASLGCGVRAAQRIGMHLEASLWANDIDQLEKEMRRRSLCSLYVVDGTLSLRMDRIPLFHNRLPIENMPQMHLVSDVDNAADAPDMFAQRTLLVQLMDFWRRHSPKTCEYDVLAAQEWYEKFCSDFLPTTPPVFALNPDKQWDSRLPKLPLQRQILHVAIFESLCYNFRPALMQDPNHVERLPGYKKVLLSSHKMALAAAALNVLDNVSKLHIMMGGSHTRFCGIIIPTFEAAVPLLCLCADNSFPDDSIDFCLNGGTLHPLATGVANLTRDKCMQAGKEALSRLQALADLSKMAEVGARALARLVARIENPPIQTGQFGESLETMDPTMQMFESWRADQIDSFSRMFSMRDVLAGTHASTLQVNWEGMEDLSGTLWDKDTLSFKNK